MTESVQRGSPATDPQAAPQDQPADVRRTGAPRSRPRLGPVGCLVRHSPPAPQQRAACPAAGAEQVCARTPAAGSAATRADLSASQGQSVPAAAVRRSRQAQARAGADADAGSNLPRLRETPDGARCAASAARRGHVRRRRVPGSGLSAISFVVPRHRMSHRAPSLPPRARPCAPAPGAVSGLQPDCIHCAASSRVAHCQAASAVLGATSARAADRHGRVGGECLRRQAAQEQRGTAAAGGAWSGPSCTSAWYGADVDTVRVQAAAVAAVDQPRLVQGHRQASWRAVARARESGRGPYIVVAGQLFVAGTVAAEISGE